MKTTQSIIIHALLGVAFLTAIALLYLVLAPHGMSNLSPSEWGVFGAALVFVLVAFGRRLLRRWRRLPPPQPLSRSEIEFCIIVALVGFILTFVGSSYGMPWLSALGIMFAPLSIMLRMNFRQPGAQ